MRVAVAVVVAAAAFILAGCAIGGKTTTVTVTRTVTSATKPPAAEAETARVKYFGFPVSATKIDQKCPETVGRKTVYFSCYALTITPQFFLVGVTANVAFAAGQTPPKTCEPLKCPAVEDDRWVIPAGTQNLTFLLPATAKGTVLTLNSSQMQTTTVTGAQLAALVGPPPATTPKLMEPLKASGLWVTVNVDAVTSFAQQFQP